MINCKLKEVMWGIKKNYYRINFKLDFLIKRYFFAWSGGSTTTKDPGSTPEISFVTNRILNGEN